MNLPQKAPHKKRGVLSSLVLILMLILVQCSVRPYKVLDRKEMRDILYDMTLVESYLDNYSYPDSIKMLFYESVLSKHEISRATYDSSLVWYSKNTPLLTDIYDDLEEKFQNKVELIDSAISDSTHLHRIRYKEVQSLWKKEGRILLSSDRYLHLFHQDIHSLKRDADSLFFSLRILPPLDSAQHLKATFILKDSSNHILKKEVHPIPRYQDRAKIAFGLPDSLPSGSVLRFLLSYRGRKRGVETLLDSIALTLHTRPVIPNDSIVQRDSILPSKDSSTNPQDTLSTLSETTNETVQ